jgi:hypothetical protein
LPALLQKILAFSALGHPCRFRYDHAAFNRRIIFMDF